MDLKRIAALRKEMFLEELQSEILEEIEEDENDDDDNDVNEQIADLKAEALIDEISKPIDIEVTNKLSDCECLPSCSSIEYDTEISQSTLDFKQYSKLTVSAHSTRLSDELRFISHRH